MFHPGARSLALCIVCFAVLVAGCAGGGAKPVALDVEDVDLGPANTADYGSRVDARDRKRMFTVLEQNQDGELTLWTNQYSNLYYRFTPINTLVFNNNPPCREFNLEIWRSDTKIKGSGVACRQPNGAWKITDYSEKR